MNTTRTLSHDTFKNLMVADQQLLEDLLQAEARMVGLEEFLTGEFLQDAGRRCQVSAGTGSMLFVGKDAEIVRAAMVKCFKRAAKEQGKKLAKLRRLASLTIGSLLDVTDGKGQIVGLQTVPTDARSESYGSRCRDVRPAHGAVAAGLAPLPCGNHGENK